MSWIADAKEIYNYGNASDRGKKLLEAINLLEYVVPYVQILNQYISDTPGLNDDRKTKDCLTRWLKDIGERLYLD
jgi:hypothetical protein